MDLDYLPVGTSATAIDLPPTVVVGPRRGRDPRTEVSDAGLAVDRRETFLSGPYTATVARPTTAE